MYLWAWLKGRWYGSVWPMDHAACSHFGLRQADFECCLGRKAGLPVECPELFRKQAPVPQQPVENLSWYLDLHPLLCGALREVGTFSIGVSDHSAIGVQCTLCLGRPSATCPENRVWSVVSG